MASIGLSQHTPDDLLDLNARVHALVDIGEVAQRIVPALLQTEIEDDVMKISGDKPVVVRVTTLEVLELGWWRKALVKGERAIHGDVVWLDSLVDEVSPD